MYSGDEKGRKRKYSKITASSAQSSDFYSKKMVVCTASSHQSSSSYYFKQCINEGCWYWLSFVIDFWTTAGDHHGDLNDFLFLVKHDVMCSKIIGNLKFKASIVFHPPWKTPCFLLLHTMYAISYHSSTASLLEYTKDDYWEKESLKKATFDGEITATDGDHECPVGSRRSVSDSYIFSFPLFWMSKSDDTAYLRCESGILGFT